MMQEIVRNPSIIRLSVSEQPRSNRWAGVRLHAVVVSIVTLSLFIENPATTLILGGLLCFPTYLYLGIKEGQRSPLWLNPLSFYFLWYSIGLGISAVYTGSVILSGAWLEFSIARIPPEDVATGYILFLVGSVALHAGIQWFRPLNPDPNASAGPDLRIDRLHWLIVLWLIGLLNSLRPDWFAPLGFFSGVFNWAALAATSILVLLPREQFRLSKLAYTILAFIATAGVLVTAVRSGSKAYIMYAFLPIIWVFIVRKPLRRYLPALGAIFITLYLVVVAPLVAMSRIAIMQKGEASISNILGVAQTWWETDDGFLNRELLWVQAEQFLKRQYDPIAVSYFVGDVNIHGFQSGATMTYMTYAFIPRVIWPEKPNVTRGSWFTSYIGFAKSEEEATTALAITATGELYWNFGISGVLVGMFLIGCMVGGLWRLAGSDPRRKPLRMLLYCILMLNINGMAEAGTVIHSTILNFIVFGSVLFALNKRSRLKEKAHVPISA